MSASENTKDCAYTALSHLISSRLLGVAPDEQDLVLEDQDWRLIVDALSHKALIRTEQSGLVGAVVPQEFLEFLRSAPVASGVCCCGDTMDDHADPMACGHVAVDRWSYSLDSWFKQIGAAS